MKNPNPKTKNDKPWAPCGSENRFDMFTSFQHFDVNFEYDNNLPKFLIDKFKEAWYAEDTDKTGKLSSWDKSNVIGYGTESKLGKVYQKITTD